MTNIFGPLTLPGNETSVLEIPGVSLTGEKGLWGKGLVLIDTLSSRTICASITVLEKNFEKYAEARFHGKIAGSIWFRWLGGNAGDSTTDTIIYTNFHHTTIDKNQTNDFTEHNWKIYVTDIFDTTKDVNNCNVLQTIFDPDDRGTGQSIGDIDTRLGKIKMSTKKDEKTKTSYKDFMTASIPADVHDLYRSLYIVIFDIDHPDLFLSCAKIKPRKFILTK